MMNQLFRNLCHHTMWKYAILWRFQHENRTILTCEDSYAIDTKSGTAMEYASYEESVSHHPWGSNIQNGNNPSCSIIVAVSNMMKISYLLGEGIVGKVASMENHLWICIEEMNTDLLLQCREELLLQVVAGIKTILLLPVLPLGLVQLGSLDKLSEDLAMVAQLKDLFYPYQYDSVSGLGMEKTDSSMTLNMPSLENYSTCLEINTKLIDSRQSQQLPIPDFTTVNFDQMISEFLPNDCVLLPHSLPQSYDPISQVGLRQAHGLNTNLLDEISLSAMCNELFGDHSEEQFMLNTSPFTGGIKESEQMISLHDNEVKTFPVIGHRFSSKNTFMFDPCDYNKAHHTFVEEFDLIIDSSTNSKYMDFNIEAGPHRAMEHNFLVDCKNSEWMDNRSKADEWSERTATSKEEMREKELESCDCANRTGLPFVEGGKKLESCDCSKSHCSSTGRCADSCLTHCKAEELSNSEDSGLQSYKLSSVSDSTGFKRSCSTCQSCGSVHTVPKNVDKRDNSSGFRGSFVKESHISHRQTKIKVSSKSRPRDRQLIQERLMELRELIPNSSKFSVDALLQRTVNHMMFLQSIPAHASKLGQSTKKKVGEEGLIVRSTPHVIESGVNWAFVQGNKLFALPLIIDNLDQPGQMLVEMRCSNYRLFLEIAQAIKHVGLTILKGILESRSQEIWAHFILEVPKGFCRLDIICPLMQLLQLKL